ncbi:NAD(P)H-dependent glycerol-3-phosphate dehydrogenase [Trueperella pyogenes]|uniref:NAD(P)H-dependent glycerol-3-phosphate dehydrogenase n=1 Tax=Trueperella pyogenes TaxID=1661 RepID=UPI0006B253BC|nr:glycerol-3-phosphate dehydrogenase [Trueperella pyogenes]ALD73230.1 glycerol-3-phosphate dehydrogenase [Trueperella pyogenes]AZR02838.1 glycerol-3-phosphate dehydrogenase [Trueperella pyogenes]
MSTITILGAGAMGSGLANAMVRAGWDVRLWGTWLDDHLIDAVEAGKPHPRIDVVISPEVSTYRSGALVEALCGADVVVMSVSSVGVPKVTKLALEGIAKADALWLTSKGFFEHDDGSISLLPDGIRSIAKATGTELPPIVAIAGPVKANECAANEPTATIFGCRDADVALRYAREARSIHYAIEPTEDEVGVEICAPMKNVYAIALGIADGLGEKSGHPHHNLKAATFSQAVREMSILSRRLGADPTTAYGLPGVGDLEVTGLSGRNKIYGARIGRGEGARAALETMDSLEQTVEGVNAIPLAIKLVRQCAADIVDELPLLFAVEHIVREDAPNYAELVAQAVLPKKP